MERRANMTTSVVRHADVRNRGSGKVNGRRPIPQRKSGRSVAVIVLHRQVATSLSWPRVLLIRLTLVLAGSYAIGCLVSAYYLTRLRHGVDIRASGSGNAGARNMARLYGWPDAIITLILDAAKGAIAVLAGLHFVGLEWAAVLALAAAIVGHIWPAQLSFHGGKGVATGLGGFLTLDPLATLAVLGVGMLSFVITRDFYRSGLAGIALAAPMLWFFGHSITTVVIAAATSLLCLVVHHPFLDAPRQPQNRTAPHGDLPRQG